MYIVNQISELKNALPWVSSLVRLRQLCKFIHDDEQDFHCQLFTQKIFQRPKTFLLILLHERQFQKYVVDHCCKVQSEHQTQLRLKQATLKAADYTNLRHQLGDSANASDKAEAVRSSHMCASPPTYVGCDQNMRQNMQEIIAILEDVRYADVFLTMTWNSQYSEI